MNHRAGLVAALVVGCVLGCGGDEPPPDSVGFYGVLVDEEFDAVGGAEFFVTSPTGERLDDGSTDPDGSFHAGGLEPTTDVSLVFSRPDDRVRTVYPGETEARDAFLFYGAVQLFDVDFVDEEIEEFTTAVGGTAALMTFDFDTAGNGAMVRGRVLAALEVEGELRFFSVPNATVTVTDGAGAEHRVYYRGDLPGDGDPGPVEPERTSTGEDSRFAAFAVPATGLSTLPFAAGLVTVRVELDFATFEERTLVVEDGVTVLDFLMVPAGL